MAEQGSEQNLTEPPSPYKLEEARKKGMVSKSLEVNSATALLTGFLAATALSIWGMRNILILSRRLLSHADGWTFDISTIAPRISSVGEQGLFIVSPLLVMVVIGAILSNILQTGPIFSTEPLTMDFQRLNPAAGLKRLFSKKSVFEAIKTLIKLGLYSSVTYFVIRDTLVELPGLYRQPIQSLPAIFIRLGNHLLFCLLIAVVFIALIDLVFTKWEFTQRMRMSKREMKEEVKRREGDPLIRNKRRELQKEMRKRSASATKVKEADVLVTNPQHYAIALQYKRNEMRAPVVLAKGAGILAKQMRDLAFEHQVQIVPNPRLARALYKEVPLGGAVPEKHYEAVAKVLKWVYQTRARRANLKGNEA